MQRQGIGLLVQWIWCQVQARLWRTGWRPFASTLELCEPVNTAAERFVATYSSDTTRGALSGMPALNRKCRSRGRAGGADRNRAATISRRGTQGNPRQLQLHHNCTQIFVAVISENSIACAVWLALTPPNLRTRIRFSSPTP